MLATSASGLLAVAHGDEVRVCDGATLLHALDLPATVIGLALSADGGALAAATTAGAVRAWRLGEAVEAYELDLGPRRVACIAWRDKSLLIAAGGEVITWAPGESASLRLLGRPVHALSQDGSIAALEEAPVVVDTAAGGSRPAREDASVELVDTATGGSLGMVPVDGRVDAFVFAPDGRSVAVAVAAGAARPGRVAAATPATWQDGRTSTGRDVIWIHVGEAARRRADAIAPLALSWDGRRLAARVRDGIVMCDASGAEVLVSGLPEARHLVFTPGGEVAAVDAGGNLRRIAPDGSAGPPLSSSLPIPPSDAFTGRSLRRASLPDLLERGAGGGEHLPGGHPRLPFAPAAGPTWSRRDARGEEPPPEAPPRADATKARRAADIRSLLEEVAATVSSGMYREAACFADVHASGTELDVRTAGESARVRLLPDGRGYRVEIVAEHPAMAEPAPASVVRLAAWVRGRRGAARTVLADIAWARALGDDAKARSVRVDRAGGAIVLELRLRQLPTAGRLARLLTAAQERAAGE